MNLLKVLATFAVAAGLVACGGGSGSGSSSGSYGSSTNASPQIAGVSAAVPSAPNVQNVAVNPNPSGTDNLLTTSVTVCAPGTNRCQTIDNVQVDTGSVGLRLQASALSSSLALPIEQLSNGNPVGACSVFGSGYTWGAVRTADVKLAGETASSIPVQIVADSATPNIPQDCASNGAGMQSPSTMHLNGILGIGMFAQDCGAGCAGSALPNWYYGCPSGANCSSTALAVSEQVTNPVWGFPTDNNGIEIVLPALPASGAASVTGALIFGIGTESNNALGSATTLPTANGSVYTSSVLDGTSNSKTILDSGSNGYFFQDSALSSCGTWYCQNATLPLTIGSDANSVSATVSVEDVNTLDTSGNTAFDDLAGGSSSGMVDIGLPFFYGRNVYSAIEGRSTPGGTGPYYAVQ